MDIRTIDPESRDYDIASIPRDPRFKQINKEAAITAILFLVHTFFLLINLVLGAGAEDPLAKMMFGLPQWLAIQLIEFVVFIIAVFVMVDKVYKNMDVTPKGKLHEK